MKNDSATIAFTLSEAIDEKIPMKKKTCHEQIYQISHEISQQIGLAFQGRWQRMLFSLIGALF